ncbi:hypothetical protein [Leptolyngbya sp. PCC 6406]|uniref:hypothetical protein n=1 Tax=Leptolyngbya sp. PCC 6406 TaxID=1173264 RepID=UPI0002AC792E|nr:hypothetical protein [Leptolyngbya sp. PCC 6406]
MGDSPDPTNTNAANPDLTADQALTQEILAGRTFSLADAIGRAGSGFLKGESTLPRLVRAQLEINGFINQHLIDVPGALQATLHQWVQADAAGISQHLEFPLGALVNLLSHILAEPPVLYELVWQVDMKWGQLSGERPHFQKPGQSPHPDDEYTHESVRQSLTQLLEIAQSAET